MTEPLRAIGLQVGGVDHGFAAAGEPVPDQYRAARVRQVHGTAIVWVGDNLPAADVEADAIASDRPGVAAAIATADCVPLLIAAPGAGVVAAVHAGWRGTLADIAGAVVRDLSARRGIRADELRVALGPSIDGCCFEIEREIAERFAARHGAAVWKAWRDGPSNDGRSHDDSSHQGRSNDGVARGTLDLRAVNRELLRAAGVLDQAIEFVGPCTFCGGGPFASYRHDGARAGRQLSWIARTTRPIG